jgi:phospholipid/cholesterol/gamma-HCH transport system substrate-binding protein/paraquat-inducible protein B
VTAIVIFGAGKIFKKVVLMETCFNTSVQGIDIGSPIKFRGVKIGEVKQIAIVDDFYPIDKEADNLQKYSLYVIVRGTLEGTRFKRFSTEEKRKGLDKLIYEEGLRIKLIPLGITGLSYLEFDFVDPESNPPLEIFWKPRYVYIPSVPSTIQQLSESVTSISKVLTNDVFPMLENLNASSENLPQITERLNEVLNDLKNTLVNVRIASNNFPNITAKLETTLSHINDVLYNQKNTVEEILENILLITSDLKDVTFELKQYPSRVIFGEAPPKQGVER